MRIKYFFANSFLLLISLISINRVFSQASTWNVLKTGAGGWITGLNMHPSGDPILVRSDVGGAYRYDSLNKCWIQIVTAERFAQNEVFWQNYMGVLSIASAPTNGNTVYMAFNDGIFKSLDKGENWIRTNFPQMQMMPNSDDSKLSGERLAVDPLNENIVYFGSINSGAFRTVDGGITWENILAIPNGSASRGVRQILFSTKEGSIGNSTKVIYICIDGIGVYQSMDAGTTWLDITSGITNPKILDSDIDSLGNLYIVGSNGNGSSFGVKKFDGTTWASPLNSSTTFLNIAIDPFDNNRAIALSNGFTTTAYTTNILSASPTWSYPSHTRNFEFIPWLSWTEDGWFTIGEVEFDPVIRDKLWITEGVGVWNAMNLNATSIAWVEHSKGQEHLVSNDLVVNANGKQITAHWDRPIFLHQNPDEYPLNHKPTQRFNSAWDMDISPANPNFIAAIIEDHRYCCYDAQHRNSGYSTDGGNTWTKFQSMPDPSNSNSIFGNIAIASNDVNNIVWLPTQNKNPYYTLDGGNTWIEVNLPNNMGNCCLNFHFVYKKALTADRVLPNTFYIYNWQNGSIYVSNDGGANWTERTALSDFWGWHAKIQSVPGYAGHLWYSHGDEDAINLISPLKRTTDGGLTWQSISNTSQVLNMTIGAPFPDATYPTIYLEGKVNSVYGYWMSKDEGATWINLEDYPLGLFDNAKVLEGDPYIAGRLYVGYGGNGFIYREGCSTDVTLAPTICDSITNTYNLSGVITFEPNINNGLVSITVDGQTIFYDLTLSSPLNVNISGLKADGLLHDVNIEYSNSSECNYTFSYYAPSGCAVCINTEFIICDDGVDFITLEADSNLYSIQWYNESGILIGENNQSLIIISTTAGLEDGIETFYYTAENINNCPGSLCCPVKILTTHCSNCINPDPPIISVQNNICPDTLIGSFNILSNCGAGTHIEWSQDGGNSWSTIIPSWGDSVSVVARCVYDADTTCFSIFSNNVIGIIQDCCFISCSHQNNQNCINPNGSSSVITDADQILWSNGASTAMISNLFAGTYTVTVTSTMTGCTNTCQTVVADATVNPTCSITVNSQPSCATLNGGSVTVVPNPAGTYTYLWNEGSTTATVNNLVGGMYTVTVTNTETNCTGVCTQTLDTPTGCCPTFNDTQGDQEICETTCIQYSFETDSPDTIDLVYFTSPASDPYVGGTYFSTINPIPSAGGGYNVILGSGASGATFDMPPGTYYMYGILSNTPSDPSCRPSVLSVINVNPLPEPTLQFVYTAYLDSIDLQIAIPYSGQFDVNITSGNLSVIQLSFGLLDGGGDIDIAQGIITLNGNTTYTIRLPYYPKYYVRIENNITNCLVLKTIYDLESGCNINNVSIQSLECIDNGTPSLMTDNILVFSALVINTNALLSTYNVTVNGGTTITPNTNVAYGLTQFHLGPGTAGGGTTFTVTVTDSLTPGCTQTFQIIDPGTCEPATQCPTPECGSATIQVNGN